MQLELLDQFEIPSPNIPLRSKLVSLSPKGKDSAYCEALISYVTRLAGAHVVRPNVLVKDVILPLTHIRLKTATRNFNIKYSRTINSYTSYASIVSAAIQKLTLQKDLQYLTFLPWGDLLDPKGSRLLRDHVGVCRECLDEFDSSGVEIYYPLLWYLRPVQICSKHQRRLCEICPDCGRGQNFVAHHAMLGYCTHCGAWLGASNRTEQSPSASPAISDRDRFMAAALEQMIAGNSMAQAIASQKRFIERLTEYSKALTNGNIKAFEIRLGFQKNVVVNWRDQCKRPRIDMFLELCFRLGRLPIQFLTADIPGDFARHISHFKRGQSSKRAKLTREEYDAIKRRLTAILESLDAPTQRAVAELLQVTVRFLNHHFTDLFRAISDRHKQVVATRTAEKRATKIKMAKAVTQTMFDQQRPISKRKIDAALHVEGLTMADGEIRQAVKEVVNENYSQKTASEDIAGVEVTKRQ